MPVPKKRTSRSRRGKRRSHDSLNIPTFSECPQCHEMTRPHRVCPHCGYYKGKERVEIAA
ncbi:MAG: 50S ribosomal protein L32 [Candidatus Nitronauta litoralis]|uniref:Large ribosomal subunit protein bL32 n=1 Tax=Candidatus Nitronauta litoralis TaxID=2705533 RepID=A0A7T0G1V1_9BACT|nr:MAG: 50S ribosomal protein L32 [Candidatus Nitronauta litoralis]